jgi:hypothetical protein
MAIGMTAILAAIGVPREAPPAKAAVQVERENLQARLERLRPKFETQSGGATSQIAQWLNWANWNNWPNWGNF